MSASILVRNRDGDEVEINLHPISLALVVSELIEETAYKRCRRKGHIEGRDNCCGRCGTSLPDDGPLYRSWLPEAYRTIRHGRAPEGTSGGGR